MFDAIAVREAHTFGFPAPVAVGVFLEDDLLDLGVGQDDEVRSGRVRQIVRPGGIRPGRSRGIDRHGASPTPDVAAR